MKRKANANRSDTESIAIGVLGWLAEDDERVLIFLRATGLDPGDLRAAARDEGLLGAVLDHVMGDEASLIACAADLELPPERIAAAWARLRPPEFDPDA